MSVFSVAFFLPLSSLFVNPTLLNTIDDLIIVIAFCDTALDVFTAIIIIISLLSVFRHGLAAIILVVVPIITGCAYVRTIMAIAAELLWAPWNSNRIPQACMLTIVFGTVLWVPDIIVGWVGLLGMDNPYQSFHLEQWCAKVVWALIIIQTTLFAILMLSKVVI
jgi:hypothetical protein